MLKAIAPATAILAVASSHVPERRAWAWGKPTLVVVDDAASRADQLRDWLSELVDAQTTGRPSLRILLERQARRQIRWLAAVIGHGQDDTSRAVRTRNGRSSETLVLVASLQERDTPNFSPGSPGAFLLWRARNGRSSKTLMAVAESQPRHDEIRTSASCSFVGLRP